MVWCQDIYYGKKNHPKWMLVWLVLKSGTLWVVPSDSKASNKKARTPKGKDRNGNAMAVATVKVATCLSDPEGHGCQGCL